MLAHLLGNGFRGKVNLIYIDPPFDSGADYVRKVSLRGPKGTVKLAGEDYTLGEQLQYTDIWANDNYLQFMFERLLLLKELLTEDGFIFLQCDHRKNHHLRCLLDEAFGTDNFRNEVASRRGTTSVQAQFENIGSLIPGYYTTFLYSKSPEARLPILRMQRAAVQPGKWDTLWRNHDRPTMRYELCGITPTEGQWRWSPTRGKGAEANYQFYLEHYAEKVDLDVYLREHFAATGEMLDMVRLGPDGTVQCYIPPQTDRLANNVWMDFPHMGSVTDYPTEKSEEMLERVLEWASKPGELVLDCFIGSGTTVAVAQKLGRRWIGCDINKGAIQTTSKRLQGIIQGQIGDSAKAKQETLPSVGEPEATSAPAQLSFAVFRVNDYDLAVHHEEAAQLACEHIGVTRTRTDAYFDGVRGKSLVKVVPFSHPLTLLDLEQLKRELDARPEEERGVLLVCLGKEPAADAWIDDWNRLRRGKDAVNRIEVIELRTDPKYGKFFQHQPAKARVKASCKKNGALVEIEDFISPTVVERLQAEAGLLKPKIDDWRAMVDCVLIDADYDGKVFRIGFSDVKALLLVGRPHQCSAYPAGPAPRGIAAHLHTRQSRREPVDVRGNASGSV